MGRSNNMTEKALISSFLELWTNTRRCYWLKGHTYTGDPTPEASKSISMAHKQKVDREVEPRGNNGVRNEGNNTTKVGRKVGNDFSQTKYVNNPAFKENQA